MTKSQWIFGKRGNEKSWFDRSGNCEKHHGQRESRAVGEVKEVNVIDASARR
jgi:hypothetical protein